MDAYDDPTLTFDDFDNERVLNLDWSDDVRPDPYLSDTLKPGTQRAFYHDYFFLKMRLESSKAIDDKLWAGFSRWDRHNRQLALALVMRAGHAGVSAIRLRTCSEYDHQGEGECVVCWIATHRTSHSDPILAPEPGRTLTDEQRQWALDNYRFVDRWAMRATVNEFARIGEWRLASGSQFVPVPTGGQDLETWYTEMRAASRQDENADRTWMVPRVNALIFNGWRGMEFAQMMLCNSDLPERRWEHAEDQGELTQIPLDTPPPEPTVVETVVLEAGEISGRIVPWDISISSGAAGWEMRFLPGSLLVPDGDTIPVTWGHDRDKRLGEVVEWDERPDGMHVRCKMDDTPEALEATALIEARLVSGFSIGGLTELQTDHYDIATQTLTTMAKVTTMDHLAVTPIPAFGEHTRIEAASTPHPSPSAILQAVGI